MPRNIIAINERLQQTLAQIFLQDIEIPKEFFVTVVKVKCAFNLKTAHAYLSVFPFEKSEEALRFIIDNRKLIQKALGERIDLQFTPRFRFSIDETEQTADEIYQTLDKINEQERDK